MLDQAMVLLAGREVEQQVQVHHIQAVQVLLVRAMPEALMAAVILGAYTPQVAAGVQVLWAELGQVAAVLRVE